MNLRAIVWLCSPLLLTAAETAPRPAGGGGPGRLMMAFEVESIVVTPDDAASMARWAELAAVGYRLAGTAAKSDGGAVLFLERMNPSGQVQLPAVVARHPAVAAAVQARIQEQQRERHPVAPPAPPAPAAPPAAEPPAAR